MAGIPDWLKPADPARYYQEAFSQGAAVAEANARLQQSANETQLRLTIEQQNQERESALAQQKLETEKAYHQQTVDLAQQKLDTLKQQADAKAAIAAKTLEARDKFNTLVAGGMSPEQAMFNAGLGTPALSAQYARTHEMSEANKTRASIDQDRINFARQKGVQVGSDTTTDPVTGAKHTVYNRQQFTNPLPPAPSQGTPLPPPPNISAPISPVTPDSNPFVQPQSNLGLDNAPVDMVTVTSPDGKTGKIPRANLGTAIKRGFKQVQTDQAAETQADAQ